MKDWDKSFLRIAYEMSTHSTCCRKQVGALVVKNNRIISSGYNGVPSGLRHCVDYFKPSDMKKPDFMKVHGEFSNAFEVHAEQNAIAECAKNEVSPVGATLYTTLAPCSNCAKLIVAAGIKRVIYEEEYDRDTKGPELLKQCGLIVQQIPYDEKEEGAANE